MKLNPDPSQQPYEPVDCNFHDQLESWATLGQQVDITYVNEHGQQKETTDTIADVFTKDKAEYVRLQSGTTIRLDQVVRVNDRTR